MQLLKQDQYSPLAVEEQVCVIFAGTKGYIDSVPVDQVGLYEKRLLEDLRANGKELLETIREEKKIDEATEGNLKAFLEDFGKSFEAS